MGNEIQNMESNTELTTNDQVLEELSVGQMKKIKKEYQMERHLACTKRGKPIKRIDSTSSELSSVVKNHIDASCEGETLNMWI